ncbi:MAG: nucleotidyltransferase family protein [Chloroflexi bacterium]|nr:nucleotidyltransferase family protein [Chloroflexota bacterium]
MIPAIVLAAGLSRRMGRFKLTLPWGATTVIGQVVATLRAVGVAEIVIVTGNRADEVAAALAGTPVRVVFNPGYATGEMLSSIQAGLRAVADGFVGASLAGKQGAGKPRPYDSAALLCLGDQPQMEVATVQAVLTAGAATGWQRIIRPSYQMCAGHPIILPSAIWPDILTTGGILREVLTAHRAITDYLVVDTPTVLADLDTPEDYTTGNWKLETGSEPPPASSF